MTHRLFIVVTSSLSDPRFAPPAASTAPAHAAPAPGFHRRRGFGPPEGSQGIVAIGIQGHAKNQREHEII